MDASEDGAGAGPGAGHDALPPAPTMAPPQLDPKLLECGICLCLLCEPVTILCGHTFCKSCLSKCLTRSNKKCPTCRAVCHLTASAANENTVVAAIAESLYPDVYASRLAEIKEAGASSNVQLPIFFYNESRMPGGVLGLNLFEPRYRIMLQRITAGDRTFCYLPNFRDYSASTNDIGLVAELEEAEEMHDGRWSIQAKLVRRVRVTETWVEPGTGNLHYCSCSYHDDEPLDEHTTGQVDEAAVRLVDTFKGLLQLQPRLAHFETGMPPATRPQQLSFFFASILEHQELDFHLESRDVLARLNKLQGTLSSILDDASTAAAGNGGSGNADDADDEDDAGNSDGDDGNESNSDSDGGGSAGEDAGEGQTAMATA